MVVNYSPVAFLPIHTHPAFKTWLPFIQQLCCTCYMWDPVLFLPLWSSQSLRWSRCADTYHGKGDKCHNGDYMGLQSGKTEEWKLGESSGRLQEESPLKLHLEQWITPCWSSRCKHRRTGLVGKTVSPVLDVRLRVASETFRRPWDIGV